MSVHPQKVYPNFNKFWYIGGGRWVLQAVCHMTQSKVEAIKVRQLRKRPISYSAFSVIKRLMVNYDTPTQYLNFCVDRCWNFSSFSTSWPSILETSNGGNSGTGHLINFMCESRVGFLGTADQIVYFWFHQIQDGRQPPSWKFQVTISVEWVVQSTLCLVMCAFCLLSAASQPHCLPPCLP